jgi:hypothetical protein
MKKNKILILISIIIALAFVYNDFDSTKQASNVEAIKNIKKEIRQMKLEKVVGQSKFLAKKIETDDLIEAFRKIQNKAFLRDEDQKKMKELYSRKQVQKAYLELKNLDATVETASKRFDLISYFLFGMKRLEDKSDVFSYVERLILSNIDSNDDIAKRMLVGDKLELIFELNKHLPEEVNQLADKVKGTHLEKIIRHAQKRSKENV